jgi:hypothetical protein
MEYDSLDGILYRIRALVKTTLMSRFSMSFFAITLYPNVVDQQQERDFSIKGPDSNTKSHRNARDPPPTDKNANSKPSADQKSSTQHSQRV